MSNLVLPTEMLERLNKPRRPWKGRRTGYSSFQTHKMVHHANGKRTRVARNMYIQGEVPLLGNVHQTRQKGKYYKEKVAAKNGR